MSTSTIVTGRHGEYRWLTSTEDYNGTILRLCPEIVLGKFAAITSVDGGVVRLVESQLAEGWLSVDGVAYSPRIDAIADIPHQYDGPDCVGYDEMYLFIEATEIGQLARGNVFSDEARPRDGRVSVFASYASFAFFDPAAEALVELFWPQLLRLSPESYLADCDQCVTFISLVPGLVETAEKRLQEHCTIE